MSQIPDNLKYTQSHEWILREGEIVTVGITDHAQELLGDLVFVELPENGTTVDAGEECAVLESVKAASDVYSPLSGEVVETNQEVADNPELVNQSPFGDGWLFKLKLNDEAELENLLDAAGYAGALEHSEEED